MNGRIIVIIFLGFVTILGVALWYAQTWAYYRPVHDTTLPITLTTGAEMAVQTTSFEGINATSSPIRYRACFTLTAAANDIRTTAMPYDDPVPLTAPRWFDCFDAVALGTALEDNTATAFLSRKDIHPGVDRVIALLPDGRGFAWHQLNDTFRD